MTHLMLTAASVFVSLGTGVQTNTVTQDGFLSGDAASIAVKLLEGAGGGADRWSSPLTVHKHHGEFYVAVPPGREFGIALKSNGWTRYEFVIEVDGVNVASGRRTT
ncbi:MAG TPA: hypothetical protein PLP17_05865, partial [Oligoflexia bacterium]|nr:hypothetical protein [Oligoflexia bacterium]